MSVHAYSASGGVDAQIKAWIDAKMRALVPQRRIAQEMLQFGADPSLYGLRVDYDDTRKTVSASQLEYYALCPRKWGFRYIDGIKVPSAASAQLGTYVHTILENWLRHGTPPDPEFYVWLFDERNGWRQHFPGRIATHGLYLLPAPASHGMEIEQSIDFDVWDGRCDLRMRAGALVASGGAGILVDPDAPVIFDHKTSTDPAKWGKTADDLRADPQALIYAKSGMLWAGANSAELRWTYFQSREPYKPRQTKVKLTVMEVDEGLGVCREKASEVLALRSYRSQGLEARQLRPNPGEACRAYGGCPYERICGLTEEQKIAGYFMTEVSMADRLAQMRAAKEAGNQAAAAPMLVAAPEVSDWEPLMGKPGWEWSPSTGQQRSLVPTEPPSAASAAVSIIAAATVLQLPPSAAITVLRAAEPGDVDGVRHAFLSARPGATHEEIVKAISERLGLIPDHVHAIIQRFSAGWIVEDRATRVNAPEGDRTSVRTQPETTAATASAIAGDEFDEMDKEKLLEFTVKHGLPIEVKRKHEKTIRELVRVAWKDRQTAERLGEEPVVVVHEPVQAETKPRAKKVPAQKVVTQQVATSIEEAFAYATLQEEHDAVIDVDVEVDEPGEMPDDESISSSASNGEAHAFALYVRCAPLRTSRRLVSVREAFADAFDGAGDVFSAIAAEQKARPRGNDIAILIGRDDMMYIGVLSQFASEVVIGT